ncbi:hypothetical protein OF385_07060 [Glutamicibacter sp. JL.03c]|nr:hypothetical protein [Glutamicibacter sp. JL.03c]UYQ78890.1 hypothetical protein OF385_07060 [Glutamicibacter sp. JL.03c]
MASAWLRVHGLLLRPSSSPSGPGAGADRLAFGAARAAEARQRWATVVQ